MLASRVTFAPQLRGTLANARSPRRDQAYRGKSEVLVPISSTNTSRLASIPASPTTITRQAASATHRVLSLPPIFFSGPSEALEDPANRVVANLHPASLPQELAPLWQCGRRALFEVHFQQLPRALVQLGLGAGTLLRSQRPPLAVGRHVALD